MRRVTFLMVLTTAAIAAGFAAVSGLAASQRPVDGCGSKLVFLVWPKGHAAIPRIAEFPEIRNPHIDVYRGFNSGYDVSAAAAWVIGGKPPVGITRGGFFPVCANYGDEVAKGTVVGKRVVITRETAVKCALPGAPVTDVVFRPGGVTDLYVHASGKILAQGHVTPRSAVLTVPSGRCTLATPPRP
jgi:hypothetical protein